MFTFDQTPVKFVGLLVLLTWCTLWCAHGLARSRGARQRVGATLHLVMAAVMLAMVPKPVWTTLTGVVPVPVIAAAFAAATVWFVWLTAGAPGRPTDSGSADSGSADSGSAHARPTDSGCTHAGHAAMFAAMTWHLAAMAVKASARAELGMGPGMRQWMEQAGRPGRVLWVFALVGLPFMAYLLIAGALALWRALRPGGAVNTDESAAHAPAAHGDCGCRDGRSDAVGHRLAALSDFAMNFGMFWMSTGLLTPILPFFAALAF